jgi:hypothetical protein
MNQQHNLDIFSRSVVGSLEGAVSYSVSTNKTDGSVLHYQKYIILHAEGLQNPFHVKWMHINIYLYVAITSIHKA